jgi:glycosyltransferase involved in cell wall biosynthesis
VRSTCIITNYNYGKYLPEALDSVLSQSAPFAEIIVVDDASSDNSSVVLSEFSKRSDKLKILRHEQNRGQLAAFETGILHSSGELIFFLDADDIYSPEYLKIASGIYQSFPQCDFLFCCPEHFANGSIGELFSQRAAEKSEPAVTDLGLSIVRTTERKTFIGAPTSCVSLRRDMANRLFPIPLYDDWRTRADDCLVFGASLAGARKFRIESTLVGYRMHEQNAFASNPAAGAPDIFFMRQIALIRLFSFLQKKFNIDGSEVGKLAHLEFKTIPRPSKQDLLEYLGYVLKNGARDAGRLKAIGLILKCYLIANSIAISAHQSKQGLLS